MRIRALVGARFVALAVAIAMAGCALVAPYDATFDQSLNQLSSDTSKFLAAAQTGGNERSLTSKEATTYYAGTYNVLVRLSQRAKLTRADIPCTTNPVLKLYWEQIPGVDPLPDDYGSFDCREFQLYAVRHYVDQLRYVHGLPGGLNPGRVRVDGNALQTAILGAIQTFIVTKPKST